MKQIYKEEELDIPSGVTVSIKARCITVTGPRGTLQKVRKMNLNFVVMIKFGDELLADDIELMILLYFLSSILTIYYYLLSITSTHRFYLNHLSTCFKFNSNQNHQFS